MSQKTKNSGFSLIEAMISMMIMAISFVGVYTLTAYAGSSLKNSADRQKMQIIANEMLELISNDYANVDSYNNMDFTTCNAPTSAQTQTYHQNRYNWCRALDAAAGTSSTGDTRKITVTTSGTNKNVRIILESRKKGAQIVINRVYGS